MATTETSDSTQSPNSDSSVGDHQKRNLADQLTLVLGQQHNLLSNQENISRHFSGDVAKIATQCWTQVHPHISETVQRRYQKVLSEFGLPEQLQRMDTLKSQYPPSLPAWRPSGIPAQDAAVAADAEALGMVAEFEALYTQAQKQTSELQQMLEERKTTLDKLEVDIRGSLAGLSSWSSDTAFPGTSSPDIDINTTYNLETDVDVVTVTSEVQLT